MAVIAGPRTPHLILRDGTLGAFYSPRILKTLYADSLGNTQASIDGVVARMNDSGPLNFMNFTSINAPVLRNENNRFYIEFDGTNDYMTGSTNSMPSASDGNGMTICVAFRYTGGSAAGTFFGHKEIGNFGAPWRFGPRINGPRNYCTARNPENTAWVNVFDTGTYTSLQSQINKDIIYTMDGYFDSTNVYGRSWLNGVLLDNRSGSISQPTYMPRSNHNTYDIGARHGNNDNWTAGRFYGAAIFSRVLTQSERQYVEDFLYTNTLV
jgi:hypothetical protein